MAPPVKDVEFTVHGVTYIRSGECSRCGDCCRGKSCPHFTDGTPETTCEIHRIRHKTGPVTFLCHECATNVDAYFYKARSGYEVKHTICNDFPNHPFLSVIKSSSCSYVFTPKTPEDEIKHQNLITLWQ